MVTKLRAILLNEADFNDNNKIFGREMEWVAEPVKLLAKEQCGSRKWRISIDHTLNTRLVIDLVRQKRGLSGICSCDLKLCYDMIRHAFVSLTTQQRGTPFKAIISMFSTIQK